MIANKWNDLREEAVTIANSHGWHDDNLSNEHYLMLIVTEIAESVEADRKNKHSDKKQYEHLVEYALREEMLYGETLEQYLKEAFQNHIKDTVEDEMADIAIRCLDLAGLRKIDLPDELHPTEVMLDKIKELSFTEWSYRITSIIVNDFLAVESVVVLVLLNLLAKAQTMEIDLQWQIRQKMEYNKTRSYKHGKQY